MARKTREESESAKASIVEYAKKHGVGRDAVEMNAIKHGYTQQYVRTILRDAGMRKPRAKQSDDRAFRIVASWQRRIEQADIARKFDVSRQYVSAVIARAKRCGVKRGTSG